MAGAYPHTVPNPLRIKVFYGVCPRGIYAGTTSARSETFSTTSVSGAAKAPDTAKAANKNNGSSKMFLMSAVILYLPARRQPSKGMGLVIFPS